MLRSATCPTGLAERERERYIFLPGTERLISAMSRIAEIRRNERGKQKNGMASGVEERYESYKFRRTLQREIQY